MCRLEIVYDKSDYTSEEKDSFSEEIFVYNPDTEQLKAQAERQRIFEHQKRKGGIINIEKEKNKFLIGIKDKKVKVAGTFWSKVNIQLNLLYRFYTPAVQQCWLNYCDFVLNKSKIILNHLIYRLSRIKSRLIVFALGRR